MGAVQTRVYRLFTFMAETGLWGDTARETTLQKMYNTTHLTDLRKAELNSFAVQSFTAAKEKVEGAE